MTLVDPNQRNERNNSRASRAPLRGVLLSQFPSSSRFSLSPASSTSRSPPPHLDSTSEQQAFCEGLHLLLPSRFPVQNFGSHGGGGGWMWGEGVPERAERTLLPNLQRWSKTSTRPLSLPVVPIPTIPWGSGFTKEPGALVQSWGWQAAGTRRRRQGPQPPPQSQARERAHPSPPEKPCWAPGGQAVTWNVAVTVEGGCNSH